MVKKYILIVACLLSLTLCALILVTNIAEASVAETDATSWARILKDDVYLYKSADVSKPLFVLEKSYYVQIVQELDSMYKVVVIPSANGDTDFVNIFGYVRKNEVSMCATPPIEPYYPAIKLSITANSTVLKEFDENASTQGWIVYNPEQMCYYGKRVIDGSTWYYVWCVNQVGYVEASAVSQPHVTLHPTPLPQTASTTPTTPDDPTDNSPKEEKLPASEILLIVFIVVLAVGLMLALFLPGNLKKRNNVFEQDI